MENFDDIGSEESEKTFSTKKRTVIVSIVALFAVAVGIFLFLFFFNSGVTIYVEFQDASTLTRGTTVLYKGIEVGKVKNMTLFLKVAAWRLRKSKSILNTPQASSRAASMCFVIRNGPGW